MSEPAVIECTDLACGYEGEAVLERVGLRIERGEIVTILGGSGSGKSTLLRTMLGLLRPLGGEVLIFGRNPYAIPEAEYRTLMRRIGVVYQQDALFGSLPLIENVMLPLRELTDLPVALSRPLAEAKLELVGLRDLADRLPSEVSGGQKKRAAIARSVILDPELVFCDEPSAGLDPIVAATIDSTLLRLRKVLGLTVVAVTHDLGSIRTISDRAIMLGGGRVAAEGTVAELERSEDPEIRAFFERRVPEEREVA